MENYSRKQTIPHHLFIYLFIYLFNENKTLSNTTYLFTTVVTKHITLTNLYEFMVPR